jgi:hypothetical protein
MWMQMQHFMMMMMQTLPSAVQVGSIFLELSPVKQQFCFPHLAHILNVSTI